MADDGQTERDEACWVRGHRAALVSMLQHVLRELGYEGDEMARLAWIAEREQAVATLRVVCDEFGDNDWSNDLHLSDVVDKHLARHLSHEDD